MNMLIIDDDGEKIDTATNFFQEKGWQVESLRNFQVISEDIWKQAFDFVLVDSVIKSTNWQAFEKVLIRDKKDWKLVLFTGATLEEIRRWKDNRGRDSLLIGAVQYAEKQIKRILRDLNETLTNKGSKDFFIITAEDRIAQIHSLRHNIINPFLALDLSLQKYIREGNDYWQREVLKDIEHLLELKDEETQKKGLDIVQASVQELFFEVAQIDSESDELKRFQFDSNQANKEAKKLIAPFRRFLEIKDFIDINAAKELKQCIGELDTRLTELIDAADRAAEH